MSQELAKNYNPAEFEDRLYQMWEQGGYFKPSQDRAKEPFSIVLPPPNITGQLHMGHALNHTLQDILIRHKRMQGFDTLWQPGTDHASIATEVKVAEKIRQETGQSKQAIGREAFLEQAWQWKERYGGRIVEQMKKLGDSCDFSKERFTLDEGLSEAVSAFFIRLYEEGYIYRGHRIINWCVDCKTSLSDAEVEHEETAGHFYHVLYAIEGSEDYLEIATTRPETILGDTAIAVHPEDPRYQALIGKRVIVPISERVIPIVADAYVDPEFGTGAVKITPAHDPNDFEVGKRHDLPQRTVMNEDGTMNEEAKPYAGLNRFECRKKIVADLQACGQLASVKDHTHNVGHCYRCDHIVEPLLSRQWFVKMQDLAQPALEALEQQRLEFVPERFAKTYQSWLENIRDWCISRQLWWGHRIPAYYCQACDEVIVAQSAPAHCPKCQSPNLRQDEDVLDTWFSSALWPMSTLGWPKQTPAFLRYFPTSLLVTGSDIIFFWVVRMVFSSLYLTAEVPFQAVLINGIVRDDQGRKMSKSLGNGVDPLELIERYGADALRFSLVTGSTPGNDMRFHLEKVENARNFANKLWNASRFILMNLQGKEALLQNDLSLPENLEAPDQWILSELNRLVGEVNKNLDRYETGYAAAKIYDFTWSYFCDWYIELVKKRLYEGDEKTKTSALETLCLVLKEILALLHPFMPFITEEIWSHMQQSQPLIIRLYPTTCQERCFPEQEQDINRVIEAIRGIRNLRSQMNTPPSTKTQLLIQCPPQLQGRIGALFGMFESLAWASQVKFYEPGQPLSEDALQVNTADLQIYIPFEDLVDFEKEILRLENELKKQQTEIQRVEGKLSNPGFLAKAPATLVEQEKAKQEKFLEMAKTTRSQLEKIQTKRDTHA